MLKRKSTIVSMIGIVALSAIAFATLNDSKSSAQELESNRLPAHDIPQPILPPVSQNGFQRAQQTQLPRFNPGQGQVYRDPRRQPLAYGNQHRTSTVAKDVMLLQRATYQLPAEAAETLKTLFQHKDTSLVECRIEKIEGEASDTVSLVVTAQPHTQQAIGKFIETLFPIQKTSKPTQKPRLSEDATQAMTAPVVERVVAVNLPNMTCGGCSQAVKRYLEDLDGVTAIKANSKDRTLEFRYTGAASVNQILDEAAKSNRFFGEYELISTDVKTGSKTVPAKSRQNRLLPTTRNLQSSPADEGQDDNASGRGIERPFKTVSVELPNMPLCVVCAKKVREHLERIDSIMTVKVDTGKQKATIKCEPNTNLKSILDKAGESVSFFEDYSIEQGFTFH